MHSVTRKVTSISARFVWNSDRYLQRGGPTLVGLDLRTAPFVTANYLLSKPFYETSYHTLSHRVNVISNTLCDILPAAREFHGAVLGVNR